MNQAHNEKKNILLVEDELITGLMVQKTLGKRGYNTMLASSGEDAIEKVERTGGFDLILMDINLGDGIDGTETADRILQKYDLPIVFLSSHTEYDIVEKTERISSYGYIVKNSEEAVLLASIKMAFKLFDARMNERTEKEALQLSEERYRGIFNNSILGIFQTTVDGRCHTVNPAFARMLGYSSPEEMKAVVLDIASQLYANPRDRQKIIKLMSDNGGWVRNFEVQMKRKDGTRLWVMLNTRLVHDMEIRIPLIEGTCLEITEQKLSGERIKNLLREKELILREVHHRIKNNMTTIYSLLSMQADEDPNSSIRTVLSDAAGRIKSMMILYDKLYRSDNTAMLSAREYLTVLINEVIGLFPGCEQVAIDAYIDDVVLNSRILSPLGIIIYEFVNNAMRHAFRDRDDGVIMVKLARNDKQLLIVFGDNGAGMPESMTMEGSTGFGLQLVNMLVMQMNGSVSIDRGDGTRFIMRIPMG